MLRIYVAKLRKKKKAGLTSMLKTEQVGLRKPARRRNTLFQKGLRALNETIKRCRVLNDTSVRNKKNDDEGRHS